MVVTPVAKPLWQVTMTKPSPNYAKGWTFGYISALNEMMQQRFQEPPEEELIWQAVKEFCADNPDASHYVASASIYIEVLRDQGGPQ